MQVVGPFIDSSSLLFGDYSPNIMVITNANFNGPDHSIVDYGSSSDDHFSIQEEYVVTPLKAITNSSSKIAANISSAAGCGDGPTCT